jgi:DNA-binding SARP family transcriptional activator
VADHHPQLHQTDPGRHRRRRGLLRTHRPGYSLDISRYDIDVFAFEDLAGEGRTAAWRQDWDTAAAIFREALRLWRGTPLADVPSSRLRDKHAAYLSDLRLSALANRIEADLQISADRAPDLVPELRRLSAEHPADKRFRGQLMAALFLSGRTGEALAVFQDAWTYAKEELGVEPGPGLRRLHHRIVSGEKNIWSCPSGAAPGSAPSAQRPRRSM